MSDINSWDLVELYRKREMSYKKFKKAIESLYEDIGEYSKNELRQSLKENLEKLES